MSLTTPDLLSPKYPVILECALYDADGKKDAPLLGVIQRDSRNNFYVTRLRGRDAMIPHGPYASLSIAKSFSRLIVTPSIIFSYVHLVMDEATMKAFLRSLQHYLQKQGANYVWDI